MARERIYARSGVMIQKFNGKGNLEDVLDTSAGKMFKQEVVQNPAEDNKEPAKEVKEEI